MPELTLGWQAILWIEGMYDKDGNEVIACNLLNDEGKPFKLTREQARFLLWFYAIDENGRFVYRNVILQRLKGWGKDPLAACIASLEFIGPCRFGGWAMRDMPELGLMRGDPVGIENPRAWVEIAAVSAAQTVNTMAIFPSLWTDECKKKHGMNKLSIGKEVVYAHGGTRRIRAVTSSPRTLEGGRVTLVIMNEALALDTPVPTPSGWTTMGELETGDAIYGADGSQTIVTQAHPIQRDRRCFKIRFADDEEIVASDGHLWQTRLPGSNAKPKIRTTLEMFEDGRHFATPRAGARQSIPVDLPLDPYLLGAWLGDGSTGQPNITAGDEDVEELREQLERRGIVTHLLLSKDRVYRIGFSARGNGYGADGGSEHGKALRALSCYRDKHIPREYLEAGTEQRLELLRGLMDTDGHCTLLNSAIFVGRKRLAEDVLELVRSLGQLATIKFAPDKRSREGGTWRVTFTPRNIQPFSFARKAARVQSTKRGWVGIKSIEEVVSVPVRCIAVDAKDHLFQAGRSGHVTHNTHHWVQGNSGHEMAEVIERNAVKAKDGAARTLSITNAYEPSEDSVAQRQREAYEDEASGISFDTGTLYDSLEAPSSVKMAPDGIENLSAEEQEKCVRSHLSAIVIAVRGDSIWLDVDGIVSSILRKTNPPSRMRRFWFNSISAAEDSWVESDAVDAAEEILAIGERSRSADQLRAGWIVGPDEPVVTFFDGSKSNDATGLIGCRVSDGYLFTIGVWTKPPGKRGENWLVPRNEVDNRVDEMFERFNVVMFWGDPSHTADDDGSRYWDALIDSWHRKFKDRLQVWSTKSGNNQHSVNWDMTSTERYKQFTGAAEQFVGEMESKDEDGFYACPWKHDGNPLFKQHMKNARKYPNAWGTSLSKANRQSLKKIDLAVCAVGAQMMRRIFLNVVEEEASKEPGVVWGVYG